MDLTEKKDIEVEILRKFLSRLGKIGDIIPLDDRYHVHPDLLLSLHGKKIGVEILYPRNESVMNPKRCENGVAPEESYYGSNRDHVLEKIEDKLDLYSRSEIESKVKAHDLDELWLLVYGGSNGHGSDDVNLHSNGKIQSLKTKLEEIFRDSPFDRVYLSDPLITWEYDIGSNYELNVIQHEMS